MNIKLLVIATNKYTQFVPRLLASVNSFFMIGHKVQLILLTNSKKKIDGVTQVYVQHHSWPYATMLRYHKINSIVPMLEDADYLFHCDADMEFVDKVGDEILGESVATVHPGFWQSPPVKFPYEKNPASKAYLMRGKTYFAGGFNGGTKTHYLNMSQILASNIDTDSAKGIVAIWHDESHLNAYYAKHPPIIQLSPSYCYPESWTMPFSKRLLALDKNHAQMRENVKIKML